MKTDFGTIFETACVVGVIALVGCSSSTTNSSGSGAGCPAADAGCPAKEAGCPAAEAGCPAASTPGSAQEAPTGTQASIDAWIAKGEYKAWKCETAVRDGMSPSPHGKQKVCSNDKASAAGAGEFPVGASNVKELYDAAGTTIIGYAIEQKMSAGGGGSWYWFERNADGLVANGYGTAGPPKDICVGCHSLAGPNHFGHDFVFTQVK